MKNIARKAKQFTVTLTSAALALIIVSGPSSGARAGEAEAKDLLKAMSDYMAGQKAISFTYDTNFEVVTRITRSCCWQARARLKWAGPTSSAPRAPADLPMSR